jgi:hypothetical protein
MKRLLKAMGASLLMTMSLGASANVIDLFTDLQSAKDNANGEGVYSDGAISLDAPGGAGSDDILGGYRDLIVDAISAAVEQDDPFDATDTPNACDGDFDKCSKVTISGGTLSFSNDDPVVGTATVQWDGDDNDAALTFGNYSEDFVNQEGCPPGGCDHFTVGVSTVDQAFDFSIGLYTDADTFTVYDLRTNNVEGLHDIAFIFFQNPDYFFGDPGNPYSADPGGAGGAFGDFDVSCLNGGGGDFTIGANTPGGFVNSVSCGSDGPVNIHDISAMELVLNTGGSGLLTQSVDLSISAFTKNGVPEPGIITLIGAGLGLFGFVSRRRRKQA